MIRQVLTQIKHKTPKGEEVIMDIGAKASNVLPENFIEQNERSNLTAKDKLPVIFGKLSKWYADLRPVAWSGSYSDLTNKPTIPEGSAANYQVANNDTTTQPGFVPDARIVKVHGDEIDALSRDLNNRFEHFKWDVSLSGFENPAEVVIYLTSDWEWCKKHTAFSYSIMVNHAEYYTGTMYTDAYNIAWGYIQRRWDGETPSEAYTFSRGNMINGGADAVLKKLGNDSPNTITVNLIKGNGAKSLEGMRPVVLTKQENGQYAITSAPTSFGVRNERAEVDWGYNMGGASITQE